MSRKKLFGMLLTLFLCVACVAPMTVYGAEPDKSAEMTEITETEAAKQETPINKKIVSPTIKLNKKSITVNQDYTKKLKATVKNANGKKVVWSSKNKKIASVNSKGVVTGKSKGTTTITATVKGTNVKAKCKVEVTNIVCMRVKTTGYCNCAKCCGKWAKYHRTASGTRPKQGRTIAVDKRVIPMGTKVQIGGKMYVAEDTGGAIRGLKIDVFYSSHRRALAHGVKYQTVKVYY